MFHFVLKSFGHWILQFQGREPMSYFVSSRDLPIKVIQKCSLELNSKSILWKENVSSCTNLSKFFFKVAINTIDVIIKYWHDYQISHKGLICRNKWGLFKLFLTLRLPHSLNIMVDLPQVRLCFCAIPPKCTSIYTKAQCAHTR